MDPKSARAFKRILQADIDSGAVADHAASAKDRRVNPDTSPWPLHEILLKAVPIELVAGADLDPADYAIDGFDHAL